MNQMIRKMWLAMGVAGVVMVSGATDPQQIIVDGSTTVGPIAKAFAEYYRGKNPGVNITVGESGSGNGAKSLINASCDIATMSRPMKNSEKKAAQEAGVLPIENVIAMDGIVIVSHPSNPVANLKLDQIRGIYSGKIRNWKELGGPDRPIIVISRETNSGTYEAFESLVLKGEKMFSQVEYVGSNGAIRQRILNTPGAIGYVGLAFTDGVKPMKVEGIEASQDTVLDRTYPVTRPLFMYTNHRPTAGSHLERFVNLCKTPEGKKIIGDTGFVALP